MLNIDPIQKMLRRYSGMSVHGITDSGWFVEQPPYEQETQQLITPDASPIEAVKLGIPYWHSQIPSRCRNLYIDEPSKCFIGHKIYPTLSGESRMSTRDSTPILNTYTVKNVRGGDANDVTADRFIATKVPFDHASGAGVIF